MVRWGPFSWLWPPRELDDPDDAWVFRSRGKLCFPLLILRLSHDESSKRLSWTLYHDDTTEEHAKLIVHAIDLLAV